MNDSTDNEGSLAPMRLQKFLARAGVASRRGSEDLMAAGRVTVNGAVVNIPSYQLRSGDVVGVREKSKSLEVIQESLSGGHSRYSWLEWEGSQMSGKFLQKPDRADIPENIKEQLIVELYSK